MHMNFVNEYKDLGVMVDVRLKFHTHIQNIVRKAAGLSNIILISTINRDASFMVTLFHPLNQAYFRLGTALVCGMLVI